MWWLFLFGTLNSGTKALEFNETNCYPQIMYSVGWLNRRKFIASWMLQNRNMVDSLPPRENRVILKVYDQITAWPLWCRMTLPDSEYQNIIEGEIIKILDYPTPP